MKTKLVLFLGVLGLSGVFHAAADPVTTGSLVREMANLGRLGEFPDPAYKNVQFSSFDHRSRIPGGPDWYANSDGFGREPIPNFEAVLRPPDDSGVGEYLVCDVTGPGALVRFWTARIDGTIRMYLDGASEPIFDGPASLFFSRPWSPFLEDSGVSESVLNQTFAQRQAGYFPIPFARRCRIVWIGNLATTHFYEVQMRQYEPGTEVETFTPDAPRRYREAILRTAEILKDPDGNWSYSPGNSVLVMAGEVPPGSIRELAKMAGPRRIEQLTLQLRAEDLDRALRQTILHIGFDGFPWGQVQAPVGDFFGAAPGINPYQSLPFTVAPNGQMTCRFVMPFKESMWLSLENRGTQSVRATGSLHTSPAEWVDGRSLHFRARWRVDHDLVNTAVYDLPFLLARGRGVYVGTASLLENPCPVPTSYGNWWGEGDEKIFVDDDRRPSIFGTGSEDYYNYAWSSPDIFQFPYCGQPRNDGPANRGFVTNHRWHIIDAIPFQQSLGFYMEFFSHERTPGYSYARLAYHYAEPGTMDDHIPITNEDVRPPELDPWIPAARGGAMGATFHQIEDLLPPQDNVTLEENNLYAGGQLWVWHPNSPGDTLKIPLPLPESGDYVIRFTARLSPTSGAFSAVVDGRPLVMGENIVDLHVPHRLLLRNFTARPLDLPEGSSTLQLKAEDRQARPIGIDFLWLQKQD